MPLRPALILTCLTLAACSGANPSMHLMDPPVATRHLPDRLGRIEVDRVSLPQYASAPEIAAQSADGALHSFKNQIWADVPDTAITRILADQISEQSGATAIAEPWPLSEGPDRRLGVRVTRLYAGDDGHLHLAGRYYITPVGGSGRNIVRSFDISEPLARPDANGISEAQARALGTLAGRIARVR